METKHKILFQDAREFKNIENESIDLMITSPPYPMIKMWDEIFISQNKEIKKAFDENENEKIFELMHKELDKTWEEVYRTLKTGGIVCINIGDATRTINNRFQIYSNHARILKKCVKLGFSTLPSILWIKETNKPDKFMGSGTLPVGAYVTLEHEHILILRKDKKREFKKLEEKENRRESAFFWEERNIWFSDKWQDINGVFQNLKDKNLRQRSGAYPFELSYRLINMFSVYGDTVLDPFLGTGTTTISAITSGRNSVGIEIDKNFNELIFSRIKSIKNTGNEFIQKRIIRHKDFIQKREKQNKEIKYFNENLNSKVMSRQERDIKFLKIDNLEIKENEIFVDYKSL
jgi:modification methylase